MKIGFTGSRDGMTVSQRVGVIEILKEWESLDDDHYHRGDDEFHHGDCKGADEEACKLAQGLGWETYAHPCDIPWLRAYTKSDVILDPLPPLKRNRIIVDTVGLMIATPQQESEVLRSGTWATIRYARRIGRELWTIYPSGRIIKESQRSFNGD